MTEIDTSASLELLTFQVANQDYALDIMSVREIRGWARATPLPHSPKYMKGVINLRGTVLPVMDLAERLGLPVGVQSERSVIIVVLYNDMMTGLLVDAVSDIVTLTPDDLQAPPDMSMATASEGASVVRDLTVLDGKMIRVLDLACVIAQAQKSVA